jgi:hypothetical protein
MRSILFEGRPEACVQPRRSFMAENKGQGQGNQGQGRGNQGANLTQEDRERGGRNSASEQSRDRQGQFAGKAGTTAGGAGQGQRGRSDTGGEQNRGATQSRSASGRNQDTDLNQEAGANMRNQDETSMEDAERGGAEWNAEGSEEEHLRRERGMRTPNQED